MKTKIITRQEYMSNLVGKTRTQEEMDFLEYYGQVHTNSLKIEAKRIIKELNLDQHKEVDANLNYRNLRYWDMNAYSVLSLCKLKNWKIMTGTDPKSKTYIVSQSDKVCILKSCIIKELLRLKFEYTELYLKNPNKKEE
jgi:hypothetical protein